MQTNRTDFWTQWGKKRVGWFERIALKHTHYHRWNREPVGVWCVTRGTRSRRSVTSWRGGVGRETGEEVRREETHVFPWLIHVDVWWKPSQYRNYPPIINFFKKPAATHSCSSFQLSLTVEASPNPSQLPINQWKFLEAVQRKQGTKTCAVNFHWPHSAVESILGWASEDLGLPPVWPWASVKSDGQTDKLQLQSHQTMNGVLWFCGFEVHNRLSLIKYSLLRKTFKSLVHSQNTTAF